MARLMGMMGSMGASSPSLGNWAARRKPVRGEQEVKFAAAAAVILSDQYRTLRVMPGASEKEVKRAFKKLALQYHPDVCKGSNCDVQFHRINEAYHFVMSSLRRAEEQEQWEQQGCGGDGYFDVETLGMYDPNWDLWEEWMGWEGAGIRDYSSHINPYN